MLELRSILIRAGESDSAQLGVAIVNFLHDLGLNTIANKTETIIEATENIILGGLLGLASMSVAIRNVILL